LAVDDHRLVLEAVRAVLEDEDDIEFVGEAHSGSEALPLIGRMMPDLVLLDIRMPHMDGLTCLGEILRRYPKVKVVLLSAVDEPEQIQAGLRQGATAFIVKHIDPRDLASALRQASEGTVFQPLGTSDSDEDSAVKNAGITDKELVVLKALAEGRSNKQIAAELYITEQTVKFHLTNIYRKLDVSNRTEATRYAYQHGIVVNPFYEVV